MPEAVTHVAVTHGHVDHVLRLGGERTGARFASSETGVLV
jgi:hypothetical protein